jgi:hypothetical protein
MSAWAIAAFPSSCALTAIVQDREAAIQADRASRHSRLKDALRALDKAVKKGGAVTEEDKAVKRAINECKAIGGLDDEVADASAALEAAQERAASSGGGANQVEDPTQAIIDDLKANGEACYIDPGFPHTEASISPDPSRKCLVSSQTCSCPALKIRSSSISFRRQYHNLLQKPRDRIPAPSRPKLLQDDSQHDGAVCAGRKNYENAPSSPHRPAHFQY